MTKILHRELAIEVRQADADNRTVVATLSSEQPVQRFFGWEILSHKPGAVDLSRANPLPLLFNHDTDKPIGSAEDVRLEGGKLRARLRFARTERGEEVFALVRDGHIKGVSVGYFIEETEQTGVRDGVPEITVTRWTLLEASIAPVPADHAGAGIGRSVPISISRGEPMENNDTGGYRSPTEEILALSEQYGRYVTLADARNAIKSGWSPARFREFIMQKMESRHLDTAELHIGMSRSEVQQFSIARAVAAIITGDWSKAGLERATSDAVAKMLGRPTEGFYVPFDVWRRDFNVGTATEAGNLVATELRGDLFTDVFRNNLVLGPLGVRILTGLSSNIDIPKKATPSQLGLLAEVGQASETKPTTDKITLSPKRIGAFVDYSKQALIQSSLAIEPMLRDDLLQGAAVLLQDQALNGVGTGTEMRGIRNTSGIGAVIGGTNGAALSWDHIVDLESACANSNAEPTAVAGYIVNSKTRGVLKKTQKGTNLPFIWENGPMPLNGYRAGVTNSLPSNLTKGTSTTVCSSLLFSSDWSLFVIGIFGVPDVTVDPYTLAPNGQVRITLNMYPDVACRQPAAFAKMDDAITG